MFISLANSRKAPASSAVPDGGPPDGLCNKVWTNSVTKLVQMNQAISKCNRPRTLLYLLIVLPIVLPIVLLMVLRYELLIRLATESLLK